MPYYIAVYDISGKRIAKMLKLYRRYLHWIQNSVFEGELTDKQMKELMRQTRAIMNPKEDSVIVFKLKNANAMERLVLGTESNPITNIL